MRQLTHAPARGAQPVTTSGSTEPDAVYGGNPAGLAVAVVCFAIVLAAIGWGIYLVVSSS